MILTKAIAQRNVGKFIDCYKRINGIYPYEIILFPSGEPGIKTSSGVCMPIEDSGFNATHYDYMFEKEETASCN